MRRNDFKEIAKIIREYKLVQKDLGTITLEDLVHKFCVVFQQNNPAFDPGKFKRECGFYQE